MRLYTRDLYARLEQETGQSTGFRPVGFIEVASDPDRLEEYRRVAAFNRYCGVDVHEIGPREIAERFPPARTDDLLAGFYVEGDGRALFAALSLAIPGHRVLLIGTARPELPEAWVAGLEHATRLRLNRLGPKDCSRLLVDAFSSERLAEELGGSLELCPTGELGGAAFALRIPTEAPEAPPRVREEGG